MWECDKSWVHCFSGMKVVLYVDFLTRKNQLSNRNKHRAKHTIDKKMFDFYTTLYTPLSVLINSLGLLPLWITESNINMSACDYDDQVNNFMHNQLDSKSQGFSFRVLLSYQKDGVLSTSSKRESNKCFVNMLPQTNIFVKFSIISELSPYT